MLHEILLSLSGQPSSLFDFHTDENSASQHVVSLLSPPEKTLLESLGRLGRLHAQLRAHTATISSSHPSIISRAVSTAISTEHLGQFQNKILEVEKAILLGDSGYVGGYGIVPLSTVVGEFAPWKRRMEWLWEVVQFMQSEHDKDKGCTGAELIDHLRAESHTGYDDLEEMAVNLVTAAEKAWMRQLSMWLLYGNLPMFGKEDFFIQEDYEGELDASGGPDGMAHFVMRTHLLPKFVSPFTASSIFFIGKSLNHIKAKGKTLAGISEGISTSSINLQGDYIEYLSELKSPISTSKLSNAINAIRLSLSQTTLSKLLPLPKILEVLSLLHDFFLLGRGEFAMALVSHADSRVSGRSRRPESLQNKTPEGLEGIAIKEGDVTTVLAQTWSELYSLQNEEDPVDDELDLARNLLRLTINKRLRGHGSPLDPAATETEREISGVPFDDLLFPAATSLSIQVQAPLDLFLSHSEVSIYSKIHAYLLGIRRAQIRLGDLWKHSSLRRCHPAPWGPPQSNTSFGESRLKAGRQRDNTRIAQMRSIWATGSASLFVLSEIGSFFQGEVVNGSWEHFREWIEGTRSSSGSRPGSASLPNQRQESRPVSSPRNSTLGLGDSAPTQVQKHDPETLTVAHRRYISSLIHSLFLTDVPFTAAIRSLLATVDRFIALLIRLEGIQRNMDLETDEGVVDALADYPREEREVWKELRASRDDIEAGIKDVVARLRDIDDSRSEEGRRTFDLARDSAQNWQVDGAGVVSSSSACQYVPRKAAGVDRLLMKLDFGNVNT
ncbi:hypothetical protein MPDQ_007660 [Monascus purpureus]|uniref:Spindle pole body component n=1 Tax=Monascus purpureus TaxID=5098 RepID=A0A507QTU9_MONPU|nr:hypothetical protein MPDQ_007660 [Monascus purpureus]BDD55166.1 hypothetical protein MAP00_000713 [Monascus purpureus]